MKTILLSFFIAITSILVPSVAAAVPAVVKADILNVREKPSTEARRAGRLPMGTIIDMGEVTDEWCPMTWDHYNPKTGDYEPAAGFVKAEFVVPMTEEGFPGEWIGRKLYLYNNKEDIDGLVLIQRRVDGDVSLWFRTVDRELQRAGGTGTLEVREVICDEVNGRYMPRFPEVADSRFFYSPEAGLAVFGGHAWTFDAPEEEN